MRVIERIMASSDWALAGLIGAVVAVSFHEEHRTWKERGVFIGIGTVCGYFLTPLAISFYNINPRLSGGVGFLLGVFGCSLLTVGLSIIKDLDLVKLVKVRFSKIGDDK